MCVDVLQVEGNHPDRNVYKFNVYKLDCVPTDFRGVYTFSKYIEGNRYDHLYIGVKQNNQILTPDSQEWKEALSIGMNRILILADAPDTIKDCQRVQQELIYRHKPTNYPII